MSAEPLAAVTFDFWETLVRDSPDNLVPTGVVALATGIRERRVAGEGVYASDLAAEAASGDIGEARFDTQFSRGLISDAVHSGDGALGEAMRPVFIDYLRKHPDA